MTTTCKSVIADNGVQFFLPEDVEEIGTMRNMSFINSNGSLEAHFTDDDILEMYDISQTELDRIKKEFGVPNWL